MEKKTKHFEGINEQQKNPFTGKQERPPPNSAAVPTQSWKIRDSRTTKVGRLHFRPSVPITTFQLSGCHCNSSYCSCLVARISAMSYLCMRSHEPFSRFGGSTARHEPSSTHGLGILMKEPSLPDLCRSVFCLQKPTPIHTFRSNELRPTPMKAGQRARGLTRTNPKVLYGL